MWQLLELPARGMMKKYESFVAEAGIQRTEILSTRHEPAAPDSQGSHLSRVLLKD
jgi:hypothetical protein